MTRYPVVFLALAAYCSIATTQTFAGGQGSSSSQASHSPITWKGTDSLGEVDFETSCIDDNAQELVNAGLLLLHNFEYELALLNFQSAQAVETSCAFAYWGEAMSELRILHFFVNYESASDIYNRMDRAADLEKVNSKERALIDATRVLLTSGDRSAPGNYESSSLFHFRNAMRKVYEEWPGDPDIASFYSMSVLGTRVGTEDFSTNLVAGRPVEKLIPAYPKHPGVLHMTLHSYENRWQSWRSRTPGETYGKISSGSIHGLHMPSHYYYYRGDWDTLIAINQNVWESSIEQQVQLGFDDVMREYHGYTYAWLQQRHFEQAFEAIVDIIESAQSSRRDYYLAHVIADFIIQSPDDTPHRQDLIDMDFDISQTNAENQTAYLFAKAWHAFESGDRDKAHEMIDRVEKEVSIEGQPQSVIDEVEIMRAQLIALAEHHAGNTDTAVSLLRETARREDVSFIEHGIPLVIKPTHELLGDILLESRRYGEALRHYKLAAFFNRGRRLSVEGILKSAQLSNDAEEAQHAEMRLQRLLGARDDEFIVVRENNFAEEWPERFRSTDMPLELSEDQLMGLSELNIMGGGQPSEKHLRNIVERSRNPVVVLDFRQEPHGYIAGMPITWFRPYVSDRELGTDGMMSLEDDFIDFLESTPSVQVDSVEWTGGQDYRVLNSEFVSNDTVLSNAEMVEKNGARYKRFYIPVVPNDRQVAEFESFVEEMAEQDTTLYFNCWDGTGRSTEFMVMYDILKNGGEVSLETIADRQAAMGGINVLELPPQSSPNYPRSVLRRDFIIDYYQKKSATE
jgi:tetratricopeptide (TPR) repeat protein/protein tyrosine phosphatase (PTP) superfamily phosphohydrolase (DUF442 family)